MKKLVLDFESVLTERLMNERFPLIQVLLGPRQVGKTTTTLYWVEKNFSKNSFLFATAEDAGGVASWIEKLWQDAVSDSKVKILIIDEIQKIENWSETIKKLWDRGQKDKSKYLKILLLGSSSLKIQMGLSESLTGRFELIRAHHRDYTTSNSLQKMNLETYLNFGGYPGSYPFISEPNRWKNYIADSIIDTVIGKDILQVANVKSPALLKQAFYILSSLPAHEISYNKILGQLQDRGNTDLIKYYLDLFEGSYLIKPIFKFSKTVLRTRSSSPKIILMSPALSCFHKMGNIDDAYMGHVLESCVGADLIRAGFDLYYWREGKFEVDFVFEYKNKIIAIEVKSGKKKNAKGLDEFKKVYPSAETIYVTFENYLMFSKDVLAFLKRLI